ncbi:MAG: hypothetical protein FD124_2043 [Alphaproteobacteria bacterium]|nr:MAG: hypothetical protein FD160_1348 [Caulobacteraceae bacterium]TPW05713.1 MAG: hypothetical protein FD124_2043 [Alphaproteobacteria bacterium]
MSDAAIADAIKKAMGAHGAWKLKLRTAITVGRCDTSPSTARCDNLCEFGKWLYSSELSPETKRGMPFQVVRRLHAEFHDCAGQVLNLVQAGKAKEAQALLDGDFAARSDKLNRALTKWRGEVQSVAA